MYNLHFLKKAKVVSITDAGGVHFSVPFNSSVKFGLLYNPDNDIQKSVTGYLFENVSAIVSAKVCMKVQFNSSLLMNALRPRALSFIGGMSSIERSLECILTMFGIDSYYSVHYKESVHY